MFQIHTKSTRIYDCDSEQKADNKNKYIYFGGESDNVIRTHRGSTYLTDSKASAVKQVDFINWQRREQNYHFSNHDLSSQIFFK